MILPPTSSSSAKPHGRHLLHLLHLPHLLHLRPVPPLRQLPRSPPERVPRPGPGPLPAAAPPRVSRLVASELALKRCSLGSTQVGPSKVAPFEEVKRLAPHLRSKDSLSQLHPAPIWEVTNISLCLWRMEGISVPRPYISFKVKSRSILHHCFTVDSAQ